MSPTTNGRKLSQSRHSLVDCCSTIRACDHCKRRKKLCNGQKPCTLCLHESMECTYNIDPSSTSNSTSTTSSTNNAISSRSVFVTNTARRLSSGSACETCRRRKTKCDGNNPCAFCAANNLVCVNNSERRKRSSITNHNNTSSPLSLSSSSASIVMNNSNKDHSSTTTTTSLSSPSTGNHATSNNNSNNSLHPDHETIDRIEDRLRRIEQLMTVFTPNQLSHSSLYHTANDINHHHHLTSSSSSHFIRPQRHSVQGINVAKERLELQIARRALSSSPPQSVTSLEKLHAGAYITPPNSGGKNNNNQHHFHPPSASPSPPQQQYSPEMTKMTRQLSNPLTSSMYNLSLSPSSSSNNNNNNNNNLNDSHYHHNHHDMNTPIHHLPQSSLSTPLDFNHPSSHHQRSLSFSSQNDSSPSVCSPALSTSPPMPSLMDQLSKRTFATNLNYPAQNSYPIYPIIPPNSHSPTNSI
ncbi:unnamed protein product [Cunninghamella echinulata]